MSAPSARFQTPIDTGPVRPVQALTPAMEGWRKRIGRIASSFEAANKDAAQPQPQQPLPGPPLPAAQERPAAHSAGAAAARGSSNGSSGSGLQEEVLWPASQPSSSHTPSCRTRKLSRGVMVTLLSASLP